MAIVIVVKLTILITINETIFITVQINFFTKDILQCCQGRGRATLIQTLGSRRSLEVARGGDQFSIEFDIGHPLSEGQRWS